MFWNKKSEVEKVIDKYGRIMGPLLLSYLFTIAYEVTKEIELGRYDIAQNLKTNAMINISKQYNEQFLREIAKFLAKGFKNKKLLSELAAEKDKYINLSILRNPDNDMPEKKPVEDKRQAELDEDANEKIEKQLDQHQDQEKKLSDYKKLEHIEIDIQRLLNGDEEGTQIKIVAETTDYFFYDYKPASEYVAHLLRQSKTDPIDVVYFGHTLKGLCLFNNYLFGFGGGFGGGDIYAINPDTGNVSHCDWLSKNVYLRTDIGYGQDSVFQLTVKDGMLLARVNRCKSSVLDGKDPFDLDTTYELHVSFENGKYSVSRFFTEVDMSKLKVVRKGPMNRWCVVEGNGVYFFKNEKQVLAKTKKGFVLMTSYLPLAEKIVEDIEIYGYIDYPEMSLLGFHNSMSDVFLERPHGIAQSMVEAAFSGMEDWTNGIRSTEKLWIQLVGETEPRSKQITQWLSKATHMQMNAVYCLGKQYDSINVTFMLALILENIPETEWRYAIRKFAAILEPHSPNNICLEDFENFACYYGIHLNEHGAIFKKLDIGRDVDYSAIV